MRPIGRLCACAWRACEPAGQEVFRTHRFGVSVRFRVPGKSHARANPARALVSSSWRRWGAAPSAAPFLASLVRDSHARLSLQLLARRTAPARGKLVERAAGDGRALHRARPRRVRAMLKAASGGGVRGALVTWIKIAPRLHLAPSRGPARFPHYARASSRSSSPTSRSPPSSRLRRPALPPPERARPAGGLQAFTGRAVHLLLRRPPRSSATWPDGTVACSWTWSRSHRRPLLLGVETRHEDDRSLSILGRASHTPG